MAGIIENIEKLISEHGSAAIIAQQLAFAKEQFAALERKASELEREIGKLEAKLQREQLDRNDAQQELQRLRKEHEEDVLIRFPFEFKRGKRTQNKWMAFCPLCHLPANVDLNSGEPFAYCSGCAFHVELPPGTTLDSIALQLPP